MLSAFTRSKRRCGRGDGLRSQRQQVFVFCWIFLFFICFLSFLAPFRSTTSALASSTADRFLVGESLDVQQERRPENSVKLFTRSSFRWIFFFLVDTSSLRHTFGQLLELIMYQSAQINKRVFVSLSLLSTRGCNSDRGSRTFRVASKLEQTFFYFFFKSMGEGRCLWTIYGSSLSVVRWGVGSFPWKPVVVVDYKSIVVGFSR